ncbi:hypothetical protein TTHERM_00446210 (macronuclear) [Tetrahymena thermophila SB210]|uniref:Uncharacterized protein n=1 Tax=Tetrahymena thermophila (strain SB210) TaxID=312017 RepID=I7M3H1_TETTS|nr:hypothetical protein TTHERM_00446210 [Tetrahymena thermophila SB210]EAS03138.2 hypothetical protein TTHERM_00446210 [Tetrahymena thermophila SB210]|eukprot:XP_001023383.2 hypothetical protein TTHERM_00446210 [Tetrahymena thermophila SB210]
MDRSDRVDYQFYGFHPYDKQDSKEEFIQYFNSRCEWIMNQNSDELKNQFIQLEEYLSFINSYNQTKKVMKKELNKIEKIQVKPQKVNEDLSQQEKNDSKESSRYEEVYQYYEVIEEYLKQEKQEVIIEKHKQNEELEQKDLIKRKIKNLKETAFKKAWQILYFNPLSVSAKQCFIHLQLHQYYLEWLEFVFKEIKKSGEINECTIYMNDLNLQDHIVQNISDHLFDEINGCDSLIVYKLILKNNKLNHINNLLRLFPPKFTHLTLELQNNQLLDCSFAQFLIFGNIQILTLYIDNNPTLTAKCLTNLANNIHKNLEVELFICETLYQNDAIIDFVGKCHSLKINDKQLIYNNSFLLEIQLENVNESQFQKLMAIIVNNINFDQQSQQHPVSMQDKLFTFSSRQNFTSKNQKSTQLINLEEDNKDRRNQQGSQPQSSSHVGQTKNKSQIDLETNKKDIQSNEILEKGKPVSNEEQKEDDEEEDDLELTEKKDIILQINGIKILDTSEDSQLIMNLSQFEMSIFDDRNLYQMISQLPKIPTNLQVKNYNDMQKKDKQIIKLILSRRENIITINEKTYDMKTFVINLSHFTEVEHELVFLIQNLQQNTSIENLEVQITSSSDNADIILNNLIKYYDSLESPKLKELKISTDITQDLFLIQNLNRKYTLAVNSQLPLYRKLSDNIIRVDSVAYQQGQSKQFNLQ